LALALFSTSDAKDFTFDFADLQKTGIDGARRELEEVTRAGVRYRNDVVAEGYDGDDLERMMKMVLQSGKRQVEVDSLSRVRQASDDTRAIEVIVAFHLDCGIRPHSKDVHSALKTSKVGGRKSLALRCRPSSQDAR
jgi:hypothetical protein